MTAATFELDPVTVALQAWLQAALRTRFASSTLLVGDAAAPLGADGLPVDPPYVVLHQVTGQRQLAWAGATHLTARWVVTSVGTTPSQARTLADGARKDLAGEDLDGQHPTALTLPGVHVVRRATLDDGALDVSGPLWQFAETVELDLTPA